MSLSDSVLQFIADHPLMHQKVQPMYRKAIFVLDDEELLQLELHSNMTDIVFYAASNTGKVYKLFSKNGNIYISSSYVPLSNSDVIWALKHNDDSVFIGTDSSVTCIKVINCEKHDWIDDCVKDPHCGWDNITELLPDNENQCFNRCRTREYLKQNDLLNKIGVYTHDNYDLSFTTPRACPPNRPKYLRATKSALKEIEIRWVCGSSDCTDHTYVISYRNAQQLSSEKLLEVQHNAADIDPQIHKISNLQPSCSYEIKLSARNDIGYSQETAFITVSTISSGSTETDNEQFDKPMEILAAVLASPVVIYILLSIVCFIIFIIRKCKQCKISGTCVNIKEEPNNGYTIENGTPPKDDDISLTGKSIGNKAVDYEHGNTNKQAWQAFHSNQEESNQPVTQSQNSNLNEKYEQYPNLSTERTTESQVNSEISNKGEKEEKRRKKKKKRKKPIVSYETHVKNAENDLLSKL
ncbi:SEMA4 [Mytilus coruscus]|uniref:SEMA4 n=1 Tax=Mytilus coruscus TaxID=42192 RepID=A0A6J7ZUK8_MYTCO|nr:SEMA4 [Mytilus coruscus]